MPSRLIGFPVDEEIAGQENCIRIEYGNMFSYSGRKADTRELVVSMMRDNPQITAKEIAEKQNLSLSGAQYQIRALQKQGRIRFEGRGGKGRWMVLKE